ncbi:hypothetical protein WEH80_21525 [Actinomycetes bacterium KLBMP 9759]
MHVMAAGWVLGAVLVAGQAPAPSADLGSCADGTCTVTVSAPTDIALDTTGADVLSVTALDGELVRMVLRSKDGVSVFITSEGGRVEAGSLERVVRIRVVSLSDGNAVLDIATKPRA